MRTYEVIFIVTPEATDEEVGHLTEGFKQIIIDQGGAIIKLDMMGKRRLAYMINHKQEGIYVLFEIEGTGREIAELERRMRVNDLVIRYLTVRVDLERRRAEKLGARRARKAEKRALSSRSNSAKRNEQNNEKAAGSAALSIDDEDFDFDEENPIAISGRNGRRIRRRRANRLLTDKVDIIDYKDAEMLKNFIPERAKIQPRRLYNTTAIHQRMLARAIKRARNIALLPFVTD